MSRIGRPPIYTPELGQAICARVADGESLRKICSEEGMPCRRTVTTWRLTLPEFNELYELAIRVLADNMADEVIEIADRGFVELGYVNRDRLRVDSRKWYLGKILPKTYGDKVHQTVTGADDGPVRVEDVRWQG